MSKLKDNSKLILSKKSFIQTKNIERKQGCESLKDNSSIKIENIDSKLRLTIDKEWALTQGAYDLAKSILLCISPLFLNENKKECNIPVPSKIPSNIKNIAFFIENMPHYTGGRYSLFHQALILSHFAKVTVYMNEKPPFIKDFELYNNPNFNITIDKNFGLNAETTEHDLVIGTPVMAGEFAVEYAKKFNIKSYLVLFESPNWISTLREGTDADEKFWAGYKKALLVCDKVIVPSYESKKWAQKWLGIDNIDVVYPCMNEAVARKVKDNDSYPSSVGDGNKHILFSARMTQFKNPLKIIKKLPKDGYVYHFLGKIWENGRLEINKMVENGYNFVLHGKVDDESKFKIMKKIDLMIFPSYFEGFGMPPMESIYFGKPVIVYDLPVLDEIYGSISGVYFVTRGDEKLFAESVKEIIEMGEVDHHIEVPDFHHPRHCADKLLSSLGIPKISTGTIVYNGDDYLGYALESVNSVVWESIVIDGKVNGYPGKTRNSVDDTELIMLNMIENDVLGKIKYVKTSKICKTKMELQNEIANLVTGDYYIKMDHDEIWTPELVSDVISFLEINPKIDIVRMDFLHFWLSFKRVAKDNRGKWSTKHPRVWRWKKGFHHHHSFNYFQDEDNQKVASPVYRERVYDHGHIFHFGWARRFERLMEKIKYYKNRQIEKNVVDTVTGWSKNEDKTQPTQESNSFAVDYDGKLPVVLKDHPYVDVDDLRKLTKKTEDGIG